MIQFLNKGKDTSDATATIDDVISPETFYNNDVKLTGNIEKLTKNELPTLRSETIINNTSYSVLDINYTDRLILLRESTTKVIVCKLDDNGNVLIDNSIEISTTDVATIGNRNVLIDAKFMYRNTNDTEIGISFVTFTNYTPWTTTYYGAIQYLKIKEFALGNIVKASIEIPADGGGNTGMILPRPNNKNCFAYYGYFTTNGKQHCLLAYYLTSQNTLATKTIFSTNGESHGTTRFGSWTVDGELIYVTDLTSTSKVYQVSDDNATWTSAYTNISHLIPLSSSIGIKNNNQLIDIKTDTVIRNLDFTINYTSTNWSVIDDYLFRYEDSNIYMYKISENLNYLNVFLSMQGVPIKNDMVYLPASTSTYHILDTLNVEKTIYGLIRKTKTYLDTSEATANASDILAGKVAYSQNGKVNGIMKNNGSLKYTPTTFEQTIPEGYTNGGVVTAMDITNSSDYETCLALTEAIMQGYDILPVRDGLLLDLEANVKNIIISNEVLWSGQTISRSVSVSNGAVDSDYSIIFNGSNTEFDTEISHSSLVGGYTIILRFCPTAWSNYKGLFGIHTGNAGIVGLQHEGGNLTWAHIGSSVALKTTTNEVPVNTWTTVAVVYDENDTGYMYVNGELVASATNFGGVNPYNNLIVGKTLASAERYFSGKMSHFFVYDRALSQDEVIQVNEYIEGGTM